MLQPRTLHRAGGPRRATFVGAAGSALLGLVLTGCADPELSVGDTSVESKADGTTTGAVTAAPESTAAPTPVVDPELEASFAPLGPFQVQLPLGWAPIEGTGGAASGATSTAHGAATYTAVPAQGKDQAAWVADLMAGTTDVVAEREGMEQQPPVTTPSGIEIFHLVHAYSDNRAHLFGYVADDQLHLVRFGLDGTPATAAVALKAVQTAHYAPPAPASPAPSGTPSETPSDTPTGSGTPTSPATTVPNLVYTYPADAEPAPGT